MSEWNGPTDEELLREEREARNREWWDNYDSVCEVRDEREEHVENEIAAVLQFMLDCMEAGATEPVKMFLTECLASAQKQESLDDTAWDYYQAHRKEIQ